MCAAEKKDDVSKDDGKDYVCVWFAYDGKGCFLFKANKILLKLLIYSSESGQNSIKYTDTIDILKQQRKQIKWDRIF